MTVTGRVTRSENPSRRASRLRAQLALLPLVRATHTRHRPLPQSGLSVPLPSLPIRLSFMMLQMSLSPRDVSILVLLALWSLLLWRHLSKPSRPSPMSPYNFSAKTPIRAGKATVLQFAAPSPAHYNDAILPTIVKTLDVLNIVEARRRYVNSTMCDALVPTISTRRSSTPDRYRVNEILESAAPMPRDEKPPLGILKSDPDSRVPFARFSPDLQTSLGRLSSPLRSSPARPSPSRRSILHIEPIPQHHPSVAQKSPSTSPPSGRRITRSGSRPATAPMVQSAASTRHELNSRSRSPFPPTREASTTSMVRGDCSDSGGDDTRLEFEVRDTWNTSIPSLTSE